MAIHLNSGHDIESVSQMQEAIESFGGAPRVKAVLCRPPLFSIKKSVKWDVVSFVNNVQYGEEGVRLWRSGYEIGRGKFIPWNKIHVPDQDKVPTLECSAVSENIKANFVPIKPRRAEFAKHLKSTKTTLMKVPMIQVKNRAIPQLKYFFCSEEGCIKSYKHHSSLQKHLECGRHKYVLEYETL